MKEITELKLPDRTIKFNPSQQRMINQILEIDGSVSKNHYREFSMFGAVRGGKSFLFQMVGWLLCAKYPNVRGLWIRDTYDQLKDSVIKQFCDDFGKYELFEYKSTVREAQFRNGSNIKFRAFDVDGMGILSSEYDFIVFCQAEAIAEQWFLLALSRLSGRKLPKPLMMTEGNPASTWPKRRYKDASPEELEKRGIFFVEMDIEGNRENLPKDFIEFLKANYPENWINRYLYGGWEQVDEMVFSEFRENDCTEPPQKPLENTKIQQGLDYGWRNPCAILWGFLDYDSRLHIFDEWGGSQKTVQEIAKEARRYGRNVIVADYSIKRPDRDGRSVWDDLCKEGLYLQESNKQEIENIALVNTLLKTKRLFIGKNCTNLLREIRNYKWKSQKIGDERNLLETPVDKDNHYIDALLYLVASLEELRSIHPDKFIPENSLLALVRKVEGSDKVWEDRG